MRKRYLTVAVALAGWVLFTPGAAQAQQVTLLDTTTTASQANSQNPRGSTYYANAHTIAMTSGGAYDIQTWTGSTIGDTGPYDTYIYLLSPTGTVLAQDDDSGQSNGGGTFSSRIQYTATASGTYTVIVSTFSPQTATKYRLMIKGPAAGAQGPVTIPNVRLTPAPRDLGALPAVDVALDLGLNRQDEFHQDDGSFCDVQVRAGSLGSASVAAARRLQLRPVQGRQADEGKAGAHGKHGDRL